jgi:hypothetical protein
MFFFKDLRYVYLAEALAQAGAFHGGTKNAYSCQDDLFLVK